MLNYIYDNFVDFTNDFNDLEKCACTTNLKIIKDKKVKKLLEHGSQTISRWNLFNPHMAINTILDCFAYTAKSLQLEGHIQLPRRYHIS